MNLGRNPISELNTNMNIDFKKYEYEHKYEFLTVEMNLMNVNII